MNLSAYLLLSDAKRNTALSFCVAKKEVCTSLHIRALVKQRKTSRSKEQKIKDKMYSDRFYSKWPTAMWTG